jgi:predicted restriction endonuclease
MGKEEVSQEDILKEYFLKNPKKDIKHADSVKWCMKEYKKRTKNVFADPDRGIRKLHQQGFLIKVSKGVYRYDPSFVKKRKLEDFTPEVKKQIFKRDNYKCIVCAKGKAEGMEIQADHILPKDKGGKATLENGQTLCSKHNFLKKNFNQTEFAKKVFIKLYSASKSLGNSEMLNFSKEVLELFEKYNIDDHIKWDR